MAKINKSLIKNIKNIEEFSADLNGCTAFIIGGNTKGKTTFCKFLFDRLMGIKHSSSPEEVLKDKENSGVAMITMDDGNAFKYEIKPNGTEKLSFISNGVEIRATKEIISKYLPNKFFDINKFILATPKEKIYLLTKALGVDVSAEIDKIQELIPIREERFREKKHKEAVYKEASQGSSLISISELQDKLSKLNEQKNKLLSEYNKTLKEIEEKNKQIQLNNNEIIEKERKKVEEHNSTIDKLESDINTLRQIYQLINNIHSKEHINIVLEEIKRIGNKIKEDIDKLGGRKTFDISALQLQELVKTPEMPDFKSIDEEIKNTERAIEIERKASMYYEEYQYAIKRYEEICDKILELENTIKDKLSRIQLPPNITITREGVFYKGLPVDDKHLSKSEMYIVSLMLSSVNLKELKTLYFDCSPLDRGNLKSIIEWANSNGYQLLIERPDFEGGELRFEIIENV